MPVFIVQVLNHFEYKYVQIRALDSKPQWAHLVKDSFRWMNTNNEAADMIVCICIVRLSAHVAW